MSYRNFQKDLNNRIISDYFSMLDKIMSLDLDFPMESWVRIVIKNLKGNGEEDDDYDYAIDELLWARDDMWDREFSGIDLQQVYDSIYEMTKEEYLEAYEILKIEFDKAFVSVKKQ